MPTEAYTPTSLGRLFGVHANTIRLWCRMYSEFLTDGAGKAPANETRRFTDADVATLSHIADLSRKHLGAAAISDALRSMDAAARRAPIVEAPQNAPDATGRTESALTVVPGLDALPALIVAQLQPLLDDAYERGRAEARRRIPPEYVLIAALVAMAAMVIASMVIMR